MHGLTNYYHTKTMEPLSIGWAEMGLLGSVARSLVVSVFDQDWQNIIYITGTGTRCEIESMDVSQRQQGIVIQGKRTDSYQLMVPTIPCLHLKMSLLNEERGF